MKIIISRMISPFFSCCICDFIWNIIYICFYLCWSKNNNLFIYNKCVVSFARTQKLSSICNTAARGIWREEKNKTSLNDQYGKFMNAKEVYETVEWWVRSAKCLIRSKKKKRNLCMKQTKKKLRFISGRVVGCLIHTIQAWLT
jgi:hypothetical protein